MRKYAENPAPSFPGEGRRRREREAKVRLAEQARGGRQDHSVIPVLFVSPFQEDYASLRGTLKSPDFCLFRTRSVQQALSVLRRVKIGVIIGECYCWRDLWTALQTGERPLARVIAATGRVDERFWNELIELGAYDVLARPFEPESVICAVTGAWAQWRREVEAVAAGGLRTAARCGA